MSDITTFAAMKYGAVSKVSSYNLEITYNSRDTSIDIGYIVESYSDNIYLDNDSVCYVCDHIYDENTKEYIIILHPSYFCESIDDILADVNSGHVSRVGCRYYFKDFPEVYFQIIDGIRKKSKYPLKEFPPEFMEIP